jgi:DNA-binding Lrp family transcriptional regulator
MELDPVDIRILELLLQNGRLSYRELAKRVGVTTPTVSSKVEHLTDMGLIEGYTIAIDPEMLDQMTVLLTIECKPSDLQTVLDGMDVREEVRELYAVDGTRVHAKVTVEDQAHLNAFLDGLGKIPQITSYNYQTVTRTVKEVPRAMLHDRQNVVVNCYYCGKPIYDEPVKIKMDGKDHFLCCQSCARLYKEKYEKLKAKAD